MTAPEYTQVPFELEDSDSKADRAARWREYLHARQGPVGLSFHDRDFTAAASGHAVGELQVVKFETGALDYWRTYRAVRRDQNYGLRILFLLDGCFKFEQGDKRDVFQPGQACLFDWGSPLRMTHDEDIRAVILGIPENSIRLPRRYEDIPLALDKTRAVVDALFSNIRILADTNKAWSAVDFTATFRATLTLVEGALTDDGASGRAESTAEYYARLALVARRLMVEHAHKRDVTPDAIAVMCGTSLKTLHTALKESEGLTPGAMLRMIRLDRARVELLGSQSVSLDEIAARAGFTSPRRFREAFQRHFELTPTQFREEKLGMGSNDESR